MNSLKLDDVLKVINNVGRCMCPFTPGHMVEGWKPDNKLGVDGNHKDYCPFGIIQNLKKKFISNENNYS